MRGTQPHLRGVKPVCPVARFSCHPEVLRGVRLACSKCLGVTKRRCTGNAIFGGLEPCVRPARRAMPVSDPMRSVPPPWAQRKCVSNGTSRRRFARAPCLRPGISGRLAFSGFFLRSGISDRQKTPVFCESAKAAVAANSATSFLLAFLRNASQILPATDDLRWAFAERVWSRRGAAIVAFSRGAWERE
jgi:hypothetical protein